MSSAAAGHCTLIGGGFTDIDRAALYNSALIRYLDFNDSYLAKGETCHPSDNLGAILAAGEYIGATGRDLMTALAVAYQVQCRLCDVAPVRARGFDHTVQGAYAVAAGVSRILELDPITDRQRHRHQWDSLHRLAGDPNRKTVTLEGTCLPESGSLLYSGHPAGQARNHGSS